MTENYWIINLISPLIGFLIIGIILKYGNIRETKNTCDYLCHGENDNYIYKHFTALQAAHDLEQRVNKLEKLMEQKEIK